MIAARARGCRIYPLFNFSIRCETLLTEQYSAETGATNIVQLPLAFVRSGYVDIPTSSVKYVSNHAQLWSRTSNSSTLAYELDAGPGYIYASNIGNYYVGRPLCCLYPGNSG